MIKLVGSAFYHEKEMREKLARFMLTTERFSFGDECKTFERAFAKWQGRKYSVLFNSGSSANLALIQALINLGRLKREDTVAFSAVTWSTNVMPLIQLGLNALPLDVTEDTLNVSSAEIQRALKRTPVKAVFLTNLLGFCDDIAVIKRVCAEAHVMLLEDNCESLGSVSSGIKLGNAGLASTFSFFIGHHLSTIEGGAVCTDDEELAVALQIVRAHGWDRQLDEKHQKALRAKHKIEPFYGLYTFYELGYNLRPTEITGLLGNAQIAYADEIVAKREKIFRHFAEVLYTKNDLYMPLRYEQMETASAMAFPLVCVSPEVRARVVERANDKVEVRPMVAGSMVFQPFFSKWQKHMIEPGMCPVAAKVHRRGFYLPIYPEMTDEDKKIIIETFSEV
ncbi:MAG: DegT/DnrJ/EryC1/StrS family aminotransferase [bacterium]|nr:DegT/DnrJ/EryC1/StrS family aminotransferase [bacterium]